MKLGGGGCKDEKTLMMRDWGRVKMAGGIYINTDTDSE